MSPNEALNYAGTDFIKGDLRRLKRLSSLEEDIFNNYRIIMGKLTDGLLPSSLFNCLFGDCLTQKTVNAETIEFYKIRVGITNPKMSPSCGVRLVYGVVRSKKSFVPILVYAACEEGRYYQINNKKLPLKKSGLVQIIDEKLKLM